MCTSYEKYPAFWFGPEFGVHFILGGITVGEAEEIKGDGVGIDGVRVPQGKKIKRIGDDARLDMDSGSDFLETELLD
jgi:hypothetical protein